MANRKIIQQLSPPQFEALFPNEDACRDYLTRNRWPSGAVKCPRCGNSKVYHLAKPHHWQCQACNKNGYRFSVLTGTIFENTNKPLRDWFGVIHMMLTSKKGVSAFQVRRVMGFGSYKTAWYMCHRIRAGLVNAEFRQLMGDRTFSPPPQNMKNSLALSASPDDICANGTCAAAPTPSASWKSQPVAEL
jgi:transposase-like protein